MQTTYEFNREKRIKVKVPDKRITSLKKQYMRPSFAIKPYSWEIDHLQYGRDGAVYYLFIINTNTRYLYVLPTTTKNIEDTARLIRRFIERELDRFGHPVISIKGDGDRGYAALANRFKDVHFFFQKSAFTYHNKIVDGAMRTLRDALGPNTNQLWNTHHDNTIQQLVEYYNTTYHSGIKMTPIEMHTDVDKEWRYIRRMTEKLNRAKNEQRLGGLLSLKRGDRVMVHLDHGKTAMSFDKRRRQFDETGVFIRYVNGNCLVQMDRTVFRTPIEVPIFFVARLPDMRRMIRDTFNSTE